MSNPIRILLVDDNRTYREALKRYFTIHSLEVIEAEDADEAMRLLKSAEPDVLITDLQMRTHTEGLDLIREARDIQPLLPIIMISAVGTFEEGAMASQLGAQYVVSKSNIDDEVDKLFALIHDAYKKMQNDSRELALIQRLRTDDQEATPDEIAHLRELLAHPNVDPYLKSEAYETLIAVDTNLFKGRSQQTLRQVVEKSSSQSEITTIEARLGESVPTYLQFDEASRESLRTAEFLFRHQDQIGTSIDFSRNMGFSYCFAVENEAKNRLKKKLARWLVSDKTSSSIKDLLEDRSQHLNLYFHQYLLQVQRGRTMDFTIDNVRQTFLRILEHGQKYKPDGLKAIGIIILCFGRDYQFKKGNQTITIDNPLNLKGLGSDQEVIELSELLINLQHFRNPYIHPEISEMEKISKIRDTTFQCLNSIAKIV